MQLSVESHRPGIAGAPETPRPAWPVASLIVFSVTSAYLLTAHLGLLLVAKPENVAVFWPASGVAAGALVLLGKSARLPVAIGVATATLVANFIDRGSLLAAASFAFANTIECLMFAWMIRRFDKAGEHLEDLRSVLVFLLSAAMSCALAAIPAVVALKLLGLSGAQLHELWLAWFTSDAVGILAVAPVLLTIRAIWNNPPGLMSIAEAALALALVLAAALYAYTLPQGSATWQFLTPATMLFPLLLWIAGRTPALFGALAALIISIVIVVSALTGENWPSSEAVPLAERITAGRIRILTVVAFTLTLTAMFARLRNLVSALGKSDARLREALSAAHMYAFDYDLASGQVLRVGSLAQKLGLPAKSNIDDYLLLIHPDDMQSRKQMFTELTPTAPVIRRRLKVRALDGTQMYIAHRVKAEFDAHGNVTRRIGTCIDVTDQNKIEQALRENEELLRQALAAGRVYAFEWDLETNIIKRSEDATEILGIPHDMRDMPREEFRIYLPPEERDSVGLLKSQISPENPFHSFTVRFIRPDGRMIWLEISERGAFDPTGQLIRLSGVSRDVSSRVLADQHQTELIGELNHRVKNTLATVRTLIARTRRDHPDTDDYMNTLLGRVTAMEHTHNRLSENAWTGVGLAEIISDELAPYAYAGDTTCSGPEITLNPAAAQAVCLTMHELATNAAKYGGLSVPGGSVEVDWRIVQTETGTRRLKLAWIEHMPHPIGKPTRESYGTRTIRNALPHEFDGLVVLDFTEHGLRCSIDLPLERVAEPHRQSEFSLATASSEPQ